MSLSEQDRIVNLQQTIVKMTITLGDQPVWTMQIEPGEAGWSSVDWTTWIELDRRGWVKIHFDRFVVLTPRGWLEGLRFSGRLKEPSFKREAGRLCRFYKDKVKGRQSWGMADIDEVVRNTGLPEGFVRNTVGAGLLGALFDIHDVCWAPEDKMESYIDIPPDFGLKILR